MFELIMKTIFNLTGPHFENDSNNTNYEYRLYVNKNLCASGKDSEKLLVYVYFMNLENKGTDFELYTNTNLYSCTHYLKDYHEKYKEVLMPIWKPNIDLSCT